MQFIVSAAHSEHHYLDHDHHDSLWVYQKLMDWEEEKGFIHSDSLLLFHDDDPNVVDEF